ncbi:hypothetical protein ABEH28_23355 [Pseudomonas sp. Ps21-P2]|uniref:DUF6933 domain-containing protein n=1 Tax=Pseudomonas sp. Ps21-P2 TaxID=3080331 RepID=UPI0032087D02
MLIFDCTKDAADFFSKKVKGEIISAVQPSAAAQSLEPDSAAHDRVDRWQLHVTKFGRTHVLLAMKVDTRYAMMFVGLKRNDVQGFLQQFSARYILEVLVLAGNVSGQIPPQSELQRHVDLLEESLQSVHFFKRSDRSVQAHINDVLYMAAYDAYEGKGLPVEAPDLIAFGEVPNGMLRSIRGGDYFIPAELELKQACPRFGMVMTEGEIADGYKRWRSRRREQDPEPEFED